MEREQRARNTRVIPKQGQPIAPSMRQPFAPTPQSPPAAAQPRAQARPRLPNLQSIGVPFRLNQRTPEPQAAAPAAPPRRGEAEPGGDEYIREKIPEGGENLLNTQESVHYSFYSRLKLAIGPVWESNTREITYRRSIRPGEYSTVVDVVLDSDGELKEIHHLQGSGIPELDRVVDTSWHRINRFPNPPRALLDKSGELHMVWTFTVHIDEGSGIRYLPPERLD